MLIGSFDALVFDESGIDIQGRIWFDAPFWFCLFFYRVSLSSTKAGNDTTIFFSGLRKVIDNHVARYSRQFTGHRR